MFSEEISSFVLSASCLARRIYYFVSGLSFATLLDLLFMPNKPDITIICITYNHEQFIAQALESFITQKTNYSFEILIGEDASTDGTRSIIEGYEHRYPGIIRPLYREKNLGAYENFRDCLRQARGKFISLCEGDDFFIAPEKLQLQADFLKKNQDYALCFHRTKHFFEDQSLGEDEVYPNPTDQHEFTLQDLLRANFISTPSVMYRRQNYSLFSSADMLPLDWYCHIFHAQFGKIGFVDHIMSAYRKHSGGLWWDSHSERENLLRRNGVLMLRAYREIFLIFQKDPASVNIILHGLSQLVENIMRADAKSQAYTIRQQFADWPELNEIIYHLAVACSKQISEITSSKKWKLILLLDRWAYRLRVKPIISMLRKVSNFVTKKTNSGISSKP
ncbi:MAG: glycosyltransferase [Bdellovibrionaceae bacterium]|nr:glycosyltransferase [Pseudobdellovibrionaceae bacterium]